VTPVASAISPSLHTRRLMRTAKVSPLNSGRKGESGSSGRDARGRGRMDLRERAARTILERQLLTLWFQHEGSGGNAGWALRGLRHAPGLP